MSDIPSEHLQIIKALNKAFETMNTSLVDPHEEVEITVGDETFYYRRDPISLLKREKCHKKPEILSYLGHCEYEHSDGCLTCLQNQIGIDRFFQSKLESDTIPAPTPTRPPTEEEQYDEWLQRQPGIDLSDADEKIIYDYIALMNRLQTEQSQEMEDNISLRVSGLTEFHYNNNCDYMCDGLCCTNRFYSRFQTLLNEQGFFIDDWVVDKMTIYRSV